MDALPLALPVRPEEVGELMGIILKRAKFDVPTFPDPHSASNDPAQPKRVVVLRIRTYRFNTCVRAVASAMACSMSLLAVLVCAQQPNMCAESKLENFRPLRLGDFLCEHAVGYGEDLCIGATFLQQRTSQLQHKVICPELPFSAPLLSGRETTRHEPLPKRPNCRPWHPRCAASQQNREGRKMPAEFWTWPQPPR